ncbi:eukaryotic translation initiation factor 5B-like [Vicia villosa]|uniref:eukaryotic translation initiation factor 5B-like n=1 Tax=Vicia villosa TaxID=3911 RepID=UPI00273CC45F|nr:eukaryotic translation initiation factor 5B-like [Vicia villosa]
MAGRTRGDPWKNSPITRFSWSGKTIALDRNSITLPPWVAVGDPLSGKTTLLDRMTLKLNKLGYRYMIDYDIAILVLDITIYLQQQTIRLINLLQTWNARFIVALNRLDRFHGWKTCSNSQFLSSFNLQSKVVKHRFYGRLKEINSQFKELGINTCLYCWNKEIGKTVSLVPTSARSGEGVLDMIEQLILLSQKSMVEKFHARERFKCTILDASRNAINVVLLNGVLHEGDQIIGPIVTTIQVLLTLPQIKKLGDKAHHIRHEKIKSVNSVKIIAKGLEHAVVGTYLNVVKPARA